MKGRQCILIACAWIGLFSASPARAVATGDFNGDLQLVVDDAVSILRSIVQLHEPTSQEIARADISGNGEMDVSDAIAVLQIIVGIRPPILDPDLRKVTVQTDPSKGVSASIPVTGGSLSATAADGTKYTLTVPDKALLSEATITMLPLAAMNDLPLSGGFTAGVHLEPEGLVLLKSATLTIEPSSPPDPNTLNGFAYAEDGENFHLYPLMLQDGKLTLSITHFSGYGVGQGNSTAQGGPGPGEAAARERVAVVIREARQRGEGDLNASDIDAIGDIARDWYHASLRDNLAAAETNEPRLVDAIREFISWLRLIELLGLEERFAFEIETLFESLARGLKSAIDQSIQGCIEHDPNQLKNALSYARFAHLMGVDSRGGLDIENVLERVRKCATFEFELETFIQQTAESGVSDMNLKTDRIQLALDDAFQYGPAQGPLHYLSFIHRPSSPECAFQTSGDGSTFLVPFARIDINFRDAPSEPGRMPDIQIGINPFEPISLPKETITLNCPEGSRTFSGQIFKAAFTIMHIEEIAPPYFMIRDWSPGTGSLYARKTYSRSKTLEGSVLEETTTMNLWHTPVP